MRSESEPHLCSSAAAFLYPGYASYKTLSKRPASEEDIERWLMYWAVLGCLVGVEYVAEWLVSWCVWHDPRMDPMRLLTLVVCCRLPLYYPMKTLFLLYLALPQTRGSTYLYQNHLQPFFHRHETQIDATLASMKNRVYAFLQERVRVLWEHVAATVGQQPPPMQPATAHAAPPPSLGDPVSGTAQLVSRMWQTYGPYIIASGVALLRPGATATTTDAAAPARRTTLVRAETVTQSMLERRRQLEAELASLPPVPGDVEVVSVMSPMPSSPSFTTSRTSSTSDLRERTVSGGRFEEIEVPSDVEGYDVSGGDSGMEYGGGERRSSWFGWGGKGAYERVKDE
jgi:receptor expression-enhancing protein 1/2/3/4